MNTIINYIIGVLIASFVLALAPNMAVAQDPTKVDAKHYTVAFENDQVRILRVSYGPREKSVLHEHPNSIAVFLVDGKIKFTLADGTSQERDVKVGQSVWNPAGKHLPENMGDKPFDVVLIEMKSK
jgi:quercetin dioxygenase-like cupin family protein